MMQIAINTDSDGCVATILAWYYKFYSQTLLLGNYSTTGGAIKVEYEQQKDRLSFPEYGGVFTQCTKDFNSGPLWNLSRCVKANVLDAGVMIEYE